MQQAITDTRTAHDTNASTPIGRTGQKICTARKGSSGKRDHYQHLALFQWMGAITVLRVKTLLFDYLHQPEQCRFGLAGLHQNLGEEPEANLAMLSGYTYSRYRRVINNGCPLLDNISSLGEAFGCNEVEESLLVLFTAARLDSDLMQVFEGIRGKTGWEWNHLLASILDCPTEDIEAALDRETGLPATGLIRVENTAYGFEDRFLVLPNLETRLARPGFTPEAISASFMERVPASTLQARHFSHLQADVNNIATVLRQAVTSASKGCNILLYGSPGVGKTELASLLASIAEAEAYRLKPAFVAGHARDGQERLDCLRVCTRLAHAMPHSLIVFDEMEDILGYIGGRGTVRHKNWFNNLLEENAIPVVWITNGTADLDEAFIRRFSYVVEITGPESEAKASLVNAVVPGFTLGEAWLASIGGSSVSPATLQRACEVSASLSADEGQFRSNVERYLGNTLKACGREFMPASWQAEIVYRPAWCNTTVDIARMADALNRSREGRVCLYGPPGTGKTALAYYLGEKLATRVHHRKVSDLLNKYIGETERNIAAMFANANKEGAILLLDEADCFLGDRSANEKTWQTSMTNELLQQMEAFRGIFIIATNLFGQLDPAVMRRFDFKLHFDYLDERQRLAVFAEQAGCREEQLEASGLSGRIRQLRKLTPGDFASVKRRLRILGEEPTAEALFSLLADEVALKGSSSSPMGFIH